MFGVVHSRVVYVSIILWFSILLQSSGQARQQQQQRQQQPQQPQRRIQAHRENCIYALQYSDLNKDGVIDIVDYQAFTLVMGYPSTPYIFTLPVELQVAFRYLACLCRSYNTNTNTIINTNANTNTTGDDDCCATEQVSVLDLTRAAEDDVYLAAICSVTSQAIDEAMGTFTSSSSLSSSPTITPSQVPPLPSNAPTVVPTITRRSSSIIPSDVPTMISESIIPTLVPTDVVVVVVGQESMIPTDSPTLQDTTTSTAPVYVPNLGSSRSPAEFEVSGIPSESPTSSSSSSSSTLRTLAPITLRTLQPTTSTTTTTSPIQNPSSQQPTTTTTTTTTTASPETTTTTTTIQVEIQIAIRNSNNIFVSYRLELLEALNLIRFEQQEQRRQRHERRRRQLRNMVPLEEQQQKQKQLLIGRRSLQNNAEFIMEETIMCPIQYAESNFRCAQVLVELTPPPPPITTVVGVGNAVMDPKQQIINSIQDGILQQYVEDLNANSNLVILGVPDTEESFTSPTFPPAININPPTNTNTNSPDDSQEDSLSTDESNSLSPIVWVVYAIGGLLFLLVIGFTLVKLHFHYSKNDDNDNDNRNENEDREDEEQQDLVNRELWQKMRQRQRYEMSHRNNNHHHDSMTTPTTNDDDHDTHPTDGIFHRESMFRPEPQDQLARSRNSVESSRSSPLLPIFEDEDSEENSQSFDDDHDDHDDHDHQHDTPQPPSSSSSSQSQVLSAPGDEKDDPTLTRNDDDHDDESSQSCATFTSSPRSSLAAERRKSQSLPSSPMNNDLPLKLTLASIIMPTGIGSLGKRDPKAESVTPSPTEETEEYYHKMQQQQKQQHDDINAADPLDWLTEKDINQPISRNAGHQSNPSIRNETDREAPTPSFSTKDTQFRPIQVETRDADTTEPLQEMPVPEVTQDNSSTRHTHIGSPSLSSNTQNIENQRVAEVRQGNYDGAEHMGVLTMANAAQFNPSTAADHDHNLDAIHRINLQRASSSRSGMSSSTDTSSSSEETSSDDGSTSSSSSSSSSSTEETQTGFTNYHPSTAGDAILAANMVGAVVSMSISNHHDKTRVPTPTSDNGDNLSTFSSVNFNPSMRSVSSRGTFLIPKDIVDATMTATAADQFQPSPSSNSPNLDDSGSPSSTSNMMEGTDSISADASPKEAPGENIEDEPNREASPGLHSRVTNGDISPWYMEEFGSGEKDDDLPPLTNIQTTMMIGTETPDVEEAGFQSAANSFDDTGSEKVSPFGSSFGSTPVTPIEDGSDFQNRTMPGSSGSSASRSNIYSPRVPPDDSLSDLQNTKSRNYHVSSSSPKESLKLSSHASPLYRLDESEAHDDDRNYMVKVLSQDDSMSDLHNARKNGKHMTASTTESIQASRRDSQSLDRLDEHKSLVDAKPIMYETNEAQVSLDDNVLPNTQKLKNAPHAFVDPFNTVGTKIPPDGSFDLIPIEESEPSEVKQWALMKSLETWNNADHTIPPGFVTSDEDDDSWDEEESQTNDDLQMTKTRTIRNVTHENPPKQTAVGTLTTTTVAEDSSEEDSSHEESSEEESSSGEEEGEGNSRKEEKGKYDFTSEEEDSSEDEESTHNLMVSSLLDDDPHKESLARTAVMHDDSSLEEETETFIGVMNEIDDSHNDNYKKDLDRNSEDGSESSEGSSSDDESSSAEDESTQRADLSEMNTVSSRDPYQVFSSEVFADSLLMFNTDFNSGNFDGVGRAAPQHRDRQVHQSQIITDSPSINFLSDIDAESPENNVPEEEQAGEDADFGQGEESEVEHDYQVYLTQATTNIPLAYASRSRAGTVTSTRTSSSSVDLLVLSDINTDSQGEDDEDGDSFFGKSSYSSSLGPSRSTSRHNVSDSPSTTRYLSEINTDEEDDDSSFEGEDDESSDESSDEE